MCKKSSVLFFILKKRANLELFIHNTDAAARANDDEVGNKISKRLLYAVVAES